MSGRHRGTYKLRMKTDRCGAQILHIPRPGFMRSSTVIIYNGVVQPLPWLAHSHAKAES